MAGAGEGVGTKATAMLMVVGGPSRLGEKEDDLSVAFTGLSLITDEEGHLFISNSFQNY